MYPASLSNFGRLHTIYWMCVWPCFLAPSLMPLTAVDQSSVTYGPDAQCSDELLKCVRKLLIGYEFMQPSVNLSTEYWSKYRKLMKEFSWHDIFGWLSAKLESATYKSIRRLVWTGRLSGHSAEWRARENVAAWHAKKQSKRRDGFNDARKCDRDAGTRKG